MCADDADALTALVGHYGQPLRQFAFVILNDADLAADVVQDVFVRLWSRRHDLSIDTVADYLFGAVRNRARDVNRHERSQSRIQRLMREQYVINPAAITEAADAAIVTEEFAAALSEAIDSLTPRVREVFLLSSIQRLSYTEIAAALGLSTTTVQSQLSRAMAHIVKRLAPFR